MLTLFHNNQQIILDNTEYYVRELASGLDEVIFDISIWDPNYALMNEEDNIVDRGGQRYLIKQIDAGAVTAKIVAQLDLDEWRASMLVGYNSGTKTVAQQIDAVKPTGWTVADRSGISIGRTISGDLTPLQVCEECRNTYKVYVRWDNNNKVVMIYSQNMGSPVGSFATRELNLKEINYKGKSQNFATRLYAYGKDGLSFADINGGKPYVDNNTYSNRVICAYWQDDRYTDKSSLLNDAQEHLAKIAVPERSYDCSIVDLQATNPELYNNLDFSLFTVATLIDDVKETAIDYQVVERHVWPYHPDHNDVIFNSAPVKIQNNVIQIEEEINNPQSTFQQILNARIEMATDWLTNSDSHVYIVEDDNGGIKEFLFVNGSQPIETATQVMRLNASGLGFSKNGVNGPFTNAFVFDSVLGGHLIADFITAGHMVADRIQGGTLESIDSTTIGGVTYKNFSLNMTTGAIEALKLSIKSANFTLTESGILTATGADISGTVSASGTIQSYTNKTELSGGALKFYKSGTLQAQLSSDYNSDGLRLAKTDWTGIDDQADLEVTGEIESRSLKVIYPNEVAFFDADDNKASIVADEIYIGGDYDQSVPTVNIGTEDGTEITIGSNYNNGSVSIVGNIDIDPNGSLKLEGTNLPSGGFYDRDGNYITVSYGLITGGI
jgi:hypothetical protein